ncbi:pelle-like serine/threonine-protein kinase pik-1 [Cloeon dipterum]|uniref:pelle-like serine/threonine-protein kinase pik-1 n=1 Tax=Cloeon dipterum TaxID=197152 RepID=UPI00321FDABC
MGDPAGGKMYIYNLPFSERRELCNILSENEKWKQLAGQFMNMSMNEISYHGRQSDPVSSVLDSWGHKNHTVQELFVILLEMEHYRAMSVLKPFIHEKYHSLIQEGDESMTRLLSALRKAPLPKVKELNFSKSDIQGDYNNVKDNYYAAVDKKREKKLNIVLPTKDEARAVSPAKSSSGENVSRESNLYTDELKRTMTEIPFHELERATSNWSDSNILGKGGFGTVYQGEWKSTKVAVKVFKKRPDSSGENNEAQFEQLLKELQILDSIRHDNILSVYGFSFGKGLVPCIVYQLMENGSLEDRLQCKRGSLPLSWYQRFEITRGTARGLQFLHTKGEKPLIHGDIKSANILLDANMKPYIGDFGLAREGPIPSLTHLTVLNVNGTKPYLPFDYLSSRQISTKVDAYSFGIVMFEIATGKRAYDKKRKPEALKDMVREARNPEELMDCSAGIQDEYDFIFPRIIFNELIRLGKICTVERAKERPEVLEVLQALERLNVPSRSASAVSHSTPFCITPMELQRHYDSLNNRSPDQNMNGLRVVTSRQHYPFPPASPSMNIPEFPLSTPSTLPTQNPFPSPVLPYRFSPMEGPPLLMVQPPSLSVSSPSPVPAAVSESPLLRDQEQEELPSLNESEFTPTVLPGGSSSQKETESSQDLVPLLTALGIKINKSEDEDQDEGVSSSDDNN